MYTASVIWIQIVTERLYNKTKMMLLANTFWVAWLWAGLSDPLDNLQLRCATAPNNTLNISIALLSNSSGVYNMSLYSESYHCLYMRTRSKMLAVNLTAIEVTSAIEGSHGIGVVHMLELTGQREHQLPKIFTVLLSHLQPNINLTLVARAR